MNDICEDDNIKPLLDKCAGDWYENGIDFGQSLYEIAMKCLEDKKKRPIMAEVCKYLEDIIRKCNIELQ